MNLHRVPLYAQQRTCTLTDLCHDVVIVMRDVMSVMCGAHHHNHDVMIVMCGTCTPLEI